VVVSPVMVSPVVVTPVMVSPVVVSPMVVSPVAGCITSGWWYHQWWYHQSVLAVPPVPVPDRLHKKHGVSALSGANLVENLVTFWVYMTAEFAESLECDIIGTFRSRRKRECWNAIEFAEFDPPIGTNNSTV